MTEATVSQEFVSTQLLNRKIGRHTCGDDIPVRQEDAFRRTSRARGIHYGGNCRASLNMAKPRCKKADGNRTVIRRRGLGGDALFLAEINELVQCVYLDVLSILFNLFDDVCVFLRESPIVDDHSERGRPRHDMGQSAQKRSIRIDSSSFRFFDRVLELSNEQTSATAILNGILDAPLPRPKSRTPSQT
jgi:hypothetical protein